MSVQQNIISIRKHIPAHVQLVCVSKFHPDEVLLEAYYAGERVFGESKVQEMCGKQQRLPKDIYWHFIGHLQTNKIKDIIKYDVQCLQSLDRLDLAEKLHQRLLFEGKKIDVFIQVNTSGEESKFGIHPDIALELVRQVAQLETLQIKGLMTIGLLSNHSEKVRACFKLLKNLQQKIIAENIPNVEMNELSMGMSGDLEIAIEEGASIIRVGSAIFGERIYPDSYYWNEGSDLT